MSTSLNRQVRLTAFLLTGFAGIAAMAALAGCCIERDECPMASLQAESQPLALVATQPVMPGTPAPAPAPAAVTPPAKPATTPADASKPAAADGRKPFFQEIPTAAFKFEMVPIPGSADGSIKPFYMSSKEITWEAADTFIYKLDEERGSPPPGGADAISRPTKPYIPPDRGFGHEGFAAITLSYQTVSQFCVWLSKHSGRGYRLATEAEWEHAARAGSPTDPGDVDSKALEEIAWFDANSSGAPHAVGTRRPNAWGLYDMLGNVQEWCVSPDGKGATRGGSYRDGPEKIKAALREPSARAWNNTDPQIPRSKWWLADAPFVGFRIVCDSETANLPTATPGAPAKPATPAPSASPSPAKPGKDDGKK